MSVCMSVCLSVIKVVIVDNGQSIRFSVFLHKIKGVYMVVMTLNLEEQKNGMMGSKVTAILNMFLSMINKGFIGSRTILPWIMVESAGDGLWLLALMTGRR